MLHPVSGAGRSPAFRADVIGLIPRLRGYAWTLTRSHDETDDLVQETLARAIANAAKFSPGTNLRAWMFTIMHNTFLNQVHKRRREAPGSEACASTYQRAAVAPVQDIRVRADEALRAIARLPEPYRQMVLLVLVQGESYEDSARICHCAVGTVKSRVSRGRALVMEDLHETGL
ncbi:sigma-70 family RNA polymerase sigma factor [Oceanicella sp. SM1341]|uniref:sigma-70 family RNA polymerase sigma factor n=1 Tax=Oceanicella sp. SM1341 TaxID=1548889 RepID=UPI000E47C4E5|nr:sigma-70 family RNA polymerase sigma factor [Oceanicella sp. SM1341]